MSSLITPRATLSYPFLAEPQKDDKGKEKYSCALVFAKGTDLTALRNALVDAAKAKWGNKVKIGKVEYTIEEAIEKGKLRLPFRTDAEEKGYPAGSTFINVRSEKKPGAVFAWADETGRPARIPQDKIAEELYPGAIVRASLSPFGYDREGNIGITFGLNNVQKLAEGERLDGRKAAEDEFTAELNEAPAAGLDDLK